MVQAHEIDEEIFHMKDSETLNEKLQLNIQKKFNRDKLLGELRKKTRYATTGAAASNGSGEGDG